MFLKAMEALKVAVEQLFPLIQSLYIRNLLKDQVQEIFGSDVEFKIKFNKSKKLSRHIYVQTFLKSVRKKFHAF